MSSVHCVAQSQNDSFIIEDIAHIFDTPDLYNLEQYSQIPSRLPTPQEVLAILVGIGAIDFLRDNLLFKLTSPLNFRNVLDLPLFVQKRCNEYCSFVQWDIFWNQTTRMNFNKCQTGVSAYLSIADDGFIGGLETILERLQALGFGFDALDIRELLNLFKDLTVQERKIGIMAQGGYTHRNWRFTFMVPLYYLERNYFLTQEERNRIADAVFDLQNQINPSQDPDTAGNDALGIEFARQHLVSDKVGLGDFRVEIDYLFKAKYSICARFGVFTTLPTAVVMKDRLFSKCNRCPVTCRPTLDLRLLIDQISNLTNFTESQVGKFLIGALDNLSAQLLNQQLGNNRHPSLGGLIRLKVPLYRIIHMPWARCITMRTRYSVEYLFPKTECRYFVGKPNPAAFDSRDFTDDNQAIGNFDFITRVITDRLYPFVLPTTVQPGIIFRSTTQFVYKGNPWGYFVGIDSWLQTAESLTNIKVPPALGQVLDVEKARRQWAYQGKVLGGITYTRKTSRGSLVTASLNGDSTSRNYGIGSDFTITIGLDCNF